MKRTIWPSASVISLRTAFSRSSNSPRYFAPATSAPMSSATMRLFFRPSGTSPRTMRPRESFDDGGLADAGLADEDRVVLGAAREHLDDAADFLVAADHRIELALPRQLGQVAAVAFERLIRAFGVLVRHALRSADRSSATAKILSRVMPRCVRSWAEGERPVSAAIADEQMFRADELVLEPVGLGLRVVGDELQPRRSTAARRRTPGGIFASSSRAALRQGCRIDVQLADELRDDAFALFERARRAGARARSARGSSARASRAPRATAS